ncbi:hypothetical protein EXIGLDRAFT_750142 [Exidia glandulosa HHB12029]|uniref:F-box domain-containing protein n=1 Tax=Exidia glandulosa HHB12029 TaxID=1314781 RepID=A0A165H3A0_EXIGL|nr:hypothetical protein EXIGLDRAFT_750142 [Exidia glandulosa HHB12029]
MGCSLLDLPNELVFHIASQSFVYEALWLTSTCKRLRKLGLESSALWHAVLEHIPAPLAPGLTPLNASAAQLRSTALAAAASHVRWSRSRIKVAVQKHIQLTSSTPGDTSSVIVFRIIRGGRWAVTCTPSGRVVLWDLETGTPAARHQIICNPHALEARTSMVDEDEDARGAVLGVYFPSSGKRYLNVLRIELEPPRIEDIAKKEISNARIPFALGVSGGARRVAAARMDTSTLLVDLFVWDYQANVDIRLRTDCVYLRDVSTLHMRLTGDMLLLYGTKGPDEVTISAVTLPPDAISTIRARKEDKAHHSCFERPYFVVGVPGYMPMPMSLVFSSPSTPSTLSSTATASFFLRAPHGASFTHHRFSLNAPEVTATGPLVQPITFSLTRASLAGDPRVGGGSHAASPILGAMAKRAMWVARGRLYACSLSSEPGTGRAGEGEGMSVDEGPKLCVGVNGSVMEEDAREMLLPAEVSRALGSVQQIAYDEAWSVLGVATDDARIWVMWY